MSSTGHRNEFDPVPQKRQATLIVELLCMGNSTGHVLLIRLPENIEEIVTF
jgi:hypothetical protein